MTRLILAGALAGSVAFVATPSASATPCVQTAVAWVCYVDLGPGFRGAAGGVNGVDYFVVGAGCYYPDGRPHYYVSAGTGIVGFVDVTVPVSAVPCV